MRKTKRTEITFETGQVLIVRRRPGSKRAWCAACEAEVEMVTVEEAAVIAGVSSRTIYRRVEAGRIYFMGTPEGVLPICGKSLSL
ncbi:MAG: helix-turn-helix domain-containing protein [Acidobacteria bacterium]|nr:helix-turn-helix domain-containing protein [Acidobacteriota bacterium]